MESGLTKLVVVLLRKTHDTGSRLLQVFALFIRPAVMVQKLFILLRLWKSNYRPGIHSCSSDRGVTWGSGMQEWTQLTQSCSVIFRVLVEKRRQISSIFIHDQCGTGSLMSTSGFLTLNSTINHFCLFTSHFNLHCRTRGIIFS